jgi:hypothetical protein
MSSSVKNKKYAGDPDDRAQTEIARTSDDPTRPANDEAPAPGPPVTETAGTGMQPTELVPKDGGGDDGGGGGGTGPWIKVTMPDIVYRDQEAGFLHIDEDDLEPLSPCGGTVLRLLCYLTYTRHGRKLLLDNPIESEATRATITAALRTKFPTLDDARIKIALDAHFAAGAYVAALKPPDPVEMARRQVVYQQRLLAMLGALYDDAMGHDFSCVW